jgi:hypothetical protein
MTAPSTLISNTVSLEANSKEAVVLAFVTSDLQITSILTKPPTKGKFEMLREKLGSFSSQRGSAKVFKWLLG